MDTKAGRATVLAALAVLGCGGSPGQPQEAGKGAGPPEAGALNPARDDITLPSDLGEVLAAASMESPYADLAPVDAAALCPVEPVRDTCLQLLAVGLASQGEPAQAAATCKAVREDKWRQECMFASAEQTLSPTRQNEVRPQYAEDAGRLCLAAGDFQGDCFTHLGSQISRNAPNADVDDAAGWRDTARAIEGVAAATTQQDPEAGARLTQRLWTATFWRSMGSARDPVGHALDDTPADQRYSFLAALGAWVVQAKAPQTLAEGAERVLLRASRRGGHRQHPSSSSQPTHELPLTPTKLWLVELPGEDALAWTYFAKDSRRAHVLDEETDLAIALVEAAARMRPPNTALLADGMGHPEPLVRWTAARLWAHVGDGATAPLSADEDLLVSARLERL